MTTVNPQVPNTVVVTTGTTPVAVTTGAQAAVVVSNPGTANVTVSPAAPAPTVGVTPVAPAPVNVLTNPATPRDTYVQQTQPTAPGPWVWYQTDASGNVIEIWTAV